MMNFLCSLTIFAAFCSPQGLELGALSVLKPAQGGTGLSSGGSIGQVIKISATSPLTYEFAADNTGGGGGGSGTVSTSSAEAATFIPFWTSTAGTPALLSGGESTFAYNSTDDRLSISYSSTTAISGSNAAFTTFVGVLTGNVTGNVTGTAGSLAGNGSNASAGNAILGVDASGNAEGAFDVWTEAENTSAAYTPQSRTLTVEGTADQITSSAGAQDLSTNRSWTLSLPNIVRFPQSFTASYGTTTYASSTAVSSSYASSSVGRFGQLFASNQSDGCAQYSSGQITSTGSACGSGGGAWPFNTETHGGTTTQSTTSPLWLKFGLHASSTSAFDDILAARATTTSATTTNLHVSGQLDIGSQTGLALTTSGVVSAYAGASCTNQFPRSQDASGAWTCATVANTDLANSTISGIALGSTLANLTATDSTLTFSGAYNGGTARTVGLNLANPNSWTALQQFTNATSTLFSATYASTTNFLSFYASSTLATTSSATTTNFAIGSLSATRIPFATTSGSILSDSAFTWENTVKRLSFTYASATSISISGTASTTNLFVSGLGSASTQCAQIAANGQITGTGSACGSGGGSGSTHWATSSPYTGQIIQYPSDTNADLVFGASSTSTAPFWFDVSHSTAYFGTSSASDSRLTFAPDGSGTTTIGIDYSNNKAFSISMSDTLGTNGALTIFPNGKTGFGSSTPYAHFSFATTATDFTVPIFQIATSSGGGYSDILSIFSTTTLQKHTSSLTNFFNDIGARVGVLTRSYQGFGGLLDHLTVKGRIRQEGWSQLDCSVPTAAVAQLNADTANVCGGAVFAEDNTATMTASTATNSGYFYNRLATSLGNDGTGVWLGGTPAGWLIAATSTPTMEVTARIANVQNATTSNFFIGFTNVNYSTSNIEILPTQGCFFAASSTEANWRAVCRTALATGTYQDTGVASSTVTTGTGSFRKFRIELDATTARFYIQGPSGNLVLTNTITHSLTTQALNAGIHYTRGTVAGTYGGNEFDFSDLWFAWRKFVPVL